MGNLTLIITITLIVIALTVKIHNVNKKKSYELQKIKSYNEKVYQTTDGKKFRNEDQAVTHQRNLDKVVFYKITLHNSKRLLRKSKYEEFNYNKSIIRKTKIDGIYVGVKPENKATKEKDYNAITSKLMIEELLFDILGSRVGFDGVDRYIRWEFSEVDSLTANNRSKAKIFDEDAIEFERKSSVIKKFHVDRNSMSQNKFDVFNELSSQSMTLFTKQTIERLSEEEK